MNTSESPSKQEIEALVEQAKGSEAALAELYELFYPKIYRYVAFRVYERTVCEDIVSNTFLKMVRNLDQYENHTQNHQERKLLKLALPNCIQRTFRLLSKKQRNDTVNSA